MYILMYFQQELNLQRHSYFFCNVYQETNDEVFNLRRAFLRQNLPNILNLLAIFFVVFFFIYLKVGQIVDLMSSNL